MEATQRCKRRKMHGLSDVSTTLSSRSGNGPGVSSGEFGSGGSMTNAARTCPEPQSTGPIGNPGLLSLLTGRVVKEHPLSMPN